jgi:hypothetical protein
VYGAIGGINGAACMTVLRLAARRAGWIEKMPPQAVQDRSAWSLGIRAPGGSVGRHVGDHALHFGIGALGGASYSALTGLTKPSPIASGVLFGFVFWALGFFVVMPWLGVSRSPRQSRPVENAVNLTAHLVFGAATGLVVDELARQPRHATAPWHRTVRMG